MLTYKIYGMHTRDDLIANLKNQLSIDDSDIHYEDRPNGGLAIYTAKKAWLSPIKPGETHRIVFPDDVEVCYKFTEICEQIVQVHPDTIVSLFCWEGRHYNKLFENLSTPYVETKFVIGAGILMPVEYIEPCFEWIKETHDDNIADDAAIQYWAKMNNIRIISTIPSLVQHLGDDSILTPGAEIRKSAYFSKHIPDSIDWSNPAILKIKPDLRFRPRGVNVIKAYE